MSVLLYVGLIVGVNMLFAHWPQHSMWWALIVGGVFIARDYAQRQVGPWVLAAMAAAAALSWWLADPFVAVASVSAFIAAEVIDWAVYSFTKRPFRDRVLFSSAASAPIDSAIFLLVAGFFAWPVFLGQVASKLAVAVVIYFVLRRQWQPRTA